MDAEELFYKYLTKEIGITEFEQMIYSLPAIESYISSSDYMDLISVNYRSKFAFDEVERIIEKYIDFAKFERMKLLNLLERSRIPGKDTGDIFIQFYELYCDGYYFLEDLGLGYGLACVVPHQARDLYDSWEELKESERIKLVGDFYPRVIQHIERVQEWIISGKIVLNGKVDDRFHFLDYRTEEEKKSRIIIETKVSKRWWEFWKQ